MGKRTEAEYLDQAIKVLAVIEAMEADPDSHHGRDMVMAMGARDVAVTALAMVRGMAEYWGQSTHQDPMALIQLVRQDLELQRAGA